MAAVNYWSDYCRLINFGEKTLIIKGWKMYLSDLDLPSFFFRQNAKGFLQCFLSLLHVEHLVFSQWIYIFGSGFCKPFFSVIIHQSKHKNIINPSVLIFKTFMVESSLHFNVMLDLAPSLQVRDLLAYHCHSCTLKSCAIKQQRKGIM